MKINCKMNSKVALINAGQQYTKQYWMSIQIRYRSCNVLVPNSGSRYQRYQMLVSVMKTVPFFTIMFTGLFNSGMVEQMKEWRYSVVLGWWWHNLCQNDALVCLSAFSSPSSSQVTVTPTSLWTILYICWSFCSSCCFSRVTSLRSVSMVVTLDGCL